MSDADRPVVVTSPGRGPIAVFAMLGLAVVAASFAWYVNFERGRKAMELFGPEAANLIRTAPEVQLLVNSTGTIDISKAPGLLHARTSLLNDASYEWNAPGDLVVEPQYSVRFAQDGASIVLLFDFENGNIQMLCGKPVKLTKKTADGWRGYLERQVTAK